MKDEWAWVYPVIVIYLIGFVLVMLSSPQWLFLYCAGGLAAPFAFAGVLAVLERFIR